MDLLLIAGVSGSGKSVAIAALEDSGYYSVSNLPVSQLAGLLAHLKTVRQDRVAIVLDAKTEPGIASIAQAIDAARRDGWTVRFLYLDAKSDTLVKRYSETRRRHPFSNDRRTLTEAIEIERDRLADARALQRENAKELLSLIRAAMARPSLSKEAHAHLAECENTLAEALKAPLQRPAA